MSLISQVIAALTNGVSEQPAAYRSPSQAEEMVNCDATLAGGLQKRLPTLLVRRLSAQILQKAFVHFVDNGSQRYFMVFTGEAPNFAAFVPNIRIFDLFGNEQPLPSANDQANYYTTPEPKRDLRAITVGDYTIVVNRLRTVEFLNTTVSNQYQEVQSFASLPAPNATPVVGYYKVLGDQQSGFGAYWVTRGGTNGNSAWVETVLPAFNNYVVVQTLPRWFFRNPTTGAWAVRDFNDAWKGRVVGDQFMSPLPSIAGKQIQDVFFYRGRLGYITTDSVVMSRSNDPTSFFPRSMLSVRDDDPIDFQMAFPKPSALRFAVPFNRSLVLFAERGQYIINADGALSPRTVKADILTEFEASNLVRPVTMGPNLYFVQPTGLSSAVRELYIGQDQLVSDAEDVTKHCPGYVPLGIDVMKASGSMDLMILSGAGGAGDLRVFRSKWDRDKRIQQAWFKWDLGSRFLLGAEFFDSSLYLVLGGSEGVTLERVDFSLMVPEKALGLATMSAADGKSQWVIHLDRLQVASGGLYDEATDTTLVTFDYPVSVTTPLEVIENFGETTGRRWEVVSRPSTTQARVRGQRVEGFLWFVGVPYTSRYVLSPIYARSQEGTPRLNGRLQLRRMRVCMENSAALRVDVTPLGRSTLSRRIDVQTRLHPVSGVGNAVVLRDYNLDLALQTDASTARIEFVNDTPYPSRIYAVEWTGYYNNRNRNS